MVYSYIYLWPTINFWPATSLAPASPSTETRASGAQFSFEVVFVVIMDFCSFVDLFVFEQKKNEKNKMWEKCSAQQILRFV